MVGGGNTCDARPADQDFGLLFHKLYTVYRLMTFSTKPYRTLRVEDLLLPELKLLAKLHDALHFLKAQLGMDLLAQGVMQFGI